MHLMGGSKQQLADGSYLVPRTIGKLKIRAAATFNRAIASVHAFLCHPQRPRLCSAL
jgi:hypothetical protein